MFRRLFSASMVMAAAISVASTSAAVASPLSFHNPLHAKMGAPSNLKPIKFSLRNDSAAVVTVQVGSKSVSLEPGKSQDAELIAGEKVTTSDGSTVYAVISSQMKNATIVIK
ncbi:MAG: hypothetical protein PW735_03535 [Acidobacteriaceae bacterium]|nr:hypothetical protein [Acidobacteriaceae bacterium]